MPAPLWRVRAFYINQPLPPTTPSSSSFILGCPIDYPGSSVFSQAKWADTVTNMEKAVDLVTQVTDSQVAHHLLRSCLDSCKVKHLFRASDPYATTQFLRADTVLLMGFEDIIGSPL